MVITGEIVPVGGYLPSRIIDSTTVRRETTLRKANLADGQKHLRQKDGFSPQKKDAPRGNTYGPDGKLTHFPLTGFRIDTYA